MEFRILGPLEVVDGDHIVALKGTRTRALLVLLLTSANQVVSADRLVDELWGATPPREAGNALQYHVSQLRKALAPAAPVATRGPGYVINVGPEELDLLRFERLVADAQDLPSPGAARVLREALGLWRGPPLADLAGEAFASRRSAASMSCASSLSSDASPPTSSSAVAVSSSPSSKR